MSLSIWKSRRIPTSKWKPALRHEHGEICGNLLQAEFFDVGFLSSRLQVTTRSVCWCDFLFLGYVIECIWRTIKTFQSWQRHTGHDNPQCIMIFWHLIDIWLNLAVSACRNGAMKGFLGICLIILAFLQFILHRVKFGFLMSDCITSEYQFEQIL